MELMCLIIKTVFYSVATHILEKLFILLVYLSKAGINFQLNAFL